MSCACEHELGLAGFEFLEVLLGKVREQGSVFLLREEGLVAVNWEGGDLKTAHLLCDKGAEGCLKTAHSPREEKEESKSRAHLVHKEKSPAGFKMFRYA